MKRRRTSWVLPLLLVACGGSTAAIVNDGGAGNVDSGLVADCPATAPAVSAPCTNAGLACEYGDDRASVCDTVAVCRSGSWERDPSGRSCPTPTAPGPTCPATYAAAAMGTSCASLTLGTLCAYPEGFCACQSPGGPPRFDAGPSAAWSCAQPSAGCPAARPRLGSPCAKAGQDCDYSICGIPEGTAVTCSTGAWETQHVACAVAN